jgi:UDP-N-acetylmuramoyl-tripeptide--D-alanyl-D-alanine ligase
MILANNGSLYFVIFWFLFFVKIVLFWLWLWQLKEYDLGRFLAHFETQPFKKIISSIWRIKYPKITFKILIIFLSCLFLEIFLILKLPLYLAILISFLVFPVIIVFFEAIALIWKKLIIKKAIKKREKFKDLIVIGITGSYGKTSTKEFISTFLEHKFGKDKVLKTEGNQNSEIAISKCILNKLSSKHKFFVVEMASYHKGGISLLCNITKPKIGIITGVNEQHLSIFRSMENLLSAEGGKELVDSLPENGAVFLNGKNKYCVDLYNKINFSNKFLYGKDSKNFIEENIAGAEMVSEFLGVDNETIKTVRSIIKNIIPGIKIKKGIKSTLVLDSSYSSNPTAVFAHLDYIKNFSRRKIVVMPCLIELGSASKNIHKKIGEKIKEVCDLAIIVTSDRFLDIKETAKDKAILIENPKKAIKKIIDFVKEGDLILFEGRVPFEIIKNIVLKNEN